MNTRSFHLFAGTRPEVVKLAPVAHALREAGADVVMVATGQQSDPALIDATFRDAGLAPDVIWKGRESSYNRRSGELYSNAMDYLSSLDSDAVAVVQGDTATVPLVAHAARRCGLPVVHVEAGLRSLNQQSLEESDRRIAAAVSSIHFAPTDLAAGFLRSEGVEEERIFVVGNTACDALRDSGVERVPVEQRKGVMFTAHRATNVDDPARLATIVEILEDLAERQEVTFPVHPRTLDRLRAYGLYDRLAAVPGVTLTEPMHYLEMLQTMAASKLVVTDSGGLQEEAAWFGIPCIVMRQSTPRWEGIVAGTAALAGVNRKHVAMLVDDMLTDQRLAEVDQLPCPYGDGHTAARIVEVLTSRQADTLLTLNEPDYTTTLPHLPAQKSTA